jgi:protein SCO1/2
VNSRERRRLFIASLLVATALVAGVTLVSALLRPGASPETSLDRRGDYGQVPAFSLVERSGQRVTREQLHGTVWVANFIYTECEESCPTQSLQLQRLQNDFAAARDLRLVSITVDPQHDTPDVLARYAERYGADRERWLFLTGDKRAIYCLAKDGFHLSVVDQGGPNPPSCRTAAWLRTLMRQALTPVPAFATHGSQGLLMHSARLVLVDRAGRIRAYHLATDAESLARLRPNLKALLGERRRIAVWLTPPALRCFHHVQITRFEETT